MDLKENVSKLEEASKLNDKCCQLWNELVGKIYLYKKIVLLMDTAKDMEDYITLMKRKNSLAKSAATKVLILSSEYKKIKGIPLVNRQVKRNKNSEIIDLVHEYGEYIEVIYKEKREKMYN